jgi:hypothetical protein
LEGNPVIAEGLVGPDGKDAAMKKIGSTSSGIVIVEMTDAEFTRLEKSQAVASGPLKRMTHDERVVYARERLAKSKPKIKEAAIHLIRDMFQFHGGVTQEEAERVIASLQKEKFLTIDAQSRIQFRNT